MEGTQYGENLKNMGAARETISDPNTITGASITLETLVSQLEKQIHGLQETLVPILTDDEGMAEKSDGAETRSATIPPAVRNLHDISNRVARIAGHVSSLSQRIAL